MVELVVLQSLSYMAGALGVCIAAIYYVLTLRAQQRNIKQTLETRQINAYLSFTSRLKDFMVHFSEVLYVYKWEDYDDFIEKYGPTNNPEAFAHIWSTLDYWNELGLLVKNGVIPMDYIYEQWSGGVIESWEKLSPLIMEWRAAGEIYLSDSFEYLYNEAKKRIPEYILFKDQLEKKGLLDKM